METFDYVIVGGGTAGCILANRLSASGRHSVLMLEAGGDGRGLWVTIPAGFSKLITNPKFNWLFETEAENSTLDRKILVPRGKGLGGSTLINGMIYVRGQPEDYDEWRDAGASGWGWDDVAPYFTRLESYDKGGEGRGDSGPMSVVEVSERFPLAQALLDAAKEDGQVINRDYNGRVQEGFCYYQMTQANGRRCSALSAYLEPARHRANLTVRTGALVSQLDFSESDDVCTGVTYMQDGRRHSVAARVEVILAAGAIQTPQVLELSGIGDPKFLHACGIPIKRELRGVGNNYIDHYSSRLAWRVRNTATLNEMTRGWRLAGAVMQYWLRHTGILTLGTGLIGAFLRSRPELTRPDIQYFFMHASYGNVAARSLERAPGMTLAMTQMRPQSRGSIHVKNRDPFTAPAIKPNYLGDPRDQQVYVDGMELARRIFSRPAMQSYVEYELTPGEEVQSPEQWLDYIRKTGQTIYHPIGTCRMGVDELAVVDPSLKLNGVKKVRIADASVMPTMISGNTQAAVMMIAERAADLILEDADRNA